MFILSKKINILIALSIVFCSAFFIINNALAFDITTQGGALNAATNAFQGTPPFSAKPGTAGALTLIGQIIGVVLAFLGVIFLVLMIYAGLTWMTARGNEQQVTKAKDLMRDAIIGLIIVLSAYAISAFVGRILTPTG